MMKKRLLALFFFLFTVTLTAEETTLRKDNAMNPKNSTIRLIYPQWQGGRITALLPDLPPEDASRGYYLGSQLLNLLAPETSHKTVTVPVSLEIGERKVENGVLDRAVILQQSQAALELLRENQPDRIVTLGGECSVSVVPFTYLAEKYGQEVAILWIDAHPDINLPGDEYPAYHAMALTACLGMGEEEIMRLLPGKVEAAKTLLVGLRAYEKSGGTKERQQELGIASLTPAEVAQNSAPILEWLEKTSAKKVLIHFDLDVLDPAEIIAAVGTDPNGLKLEQVVRILNDVAAQYDVVALTVAEPMPRLAIKLRNMLRQLPLLGE